MDKVYMLYGSIGGSDDEYIVGIYESKDMAEEDRCRLERGKNTLHSDKLWPSYHVLLDDEIYWTFEVIEIPFVAQGGKLNIK